MACVAWFSKVIFMSDPTLITNDFDTPDLEAEHLPKHQVCYFCARSFFFPTDRLTGSFFPLIA